MRPRRLLVALLAASICFAATAQAQTHSQTDRREFALWTIGFRSSLDSVADIVQRGQELDQTLASFEQGTINATVANTAIDAWLQHSQGAVEQEIHAIASQPPPPGLDPTTDYGARAHAVAINAVPASTASVQRAMRTISNVGLIAHDAVDGSRTVTDARREIIMTIGREYLQIGVDWYRLTAPLAPPQAAFTPQIEASAALSDAVIIVYDVARHAPNEGFAFTADQIVALRNDSAIIRRDIPVARARIAADTVQNTPVATEDFVRLLDLIANGADAIDNLAAAPPAANQQAFFEQTRSLMMAQAAINRISPHR